MEILLPLSLNITTKLHDCHVQQIVSEGIEEKEQYKEMKNLGIDYIQGYYFSKPVDNESFIEFIKENQ